MKYCMVLLMFMTLAIAQRGEAQTDPCPTGAPQQTAFSVKAGTATVTACHDEKDADGQPSPNIAWRIVLDGVKTPITMTRSATASASSGQYLFTGTFPITKGTHQFSLENDQADGAGGVITSSVGPFAVAAKGTGKPAANVTVK